MKKRRTRRMKELSPVTDDELISVTISARRPKWRPFYIDLPSIFSIDRAKYQRLSNDALHTIENISISTPRYISPPSSPGYSTPALISDYGSSDKPHPVARKVKSKRKLKPKRMKRMKREAEDDEYTCHQCRRKDNRPKMNCRYVRPNGQMCTLYYCDRCIYVRYGEEFDPGKTAWRCPRCYDNCNCSLCLRKAGLGNIMDSNEFKADVAAVVSARGVTLKTGVPDDAAIDMRTFLAQRDLVKGNEDWTADSSKRRRYYIGNKMTDEKKADYKMEDLAAILKELEADVDETENPSPANGSETIRADSIPPQGGTVKVVPLESDPSTDAPQGSISQTVPQSDTMEIMTLAPSDTILTEASTSTPTVVERKVRFFIGKPPPGVKIPSVRRSSKNAKRRKEIKAEEEASDPYPSLDTENNDASSVIVANPPNEAPPQDIAMRDDSVEHPEASASTSTTSHLDIPVFSQSQETKDSTTPKGSPPHPHGPILVPNEPTLVPNQSYLVKGSDEWTNYSRTELLDPPTSTYEDPYQRMSISSLSTHALRAGCNPDVMLYNGHVESDDLWDDIPPLSTFTSTAATATTAVGLTYLPDPSATMTYSPRI
ncbi:hypothetical protein M422DRAFT_55784 [Sphaerobolus stellatus SS14]|uniref:Zinc-finger domain-containing protein n=1 Tax=Sphaerobolus stellatus (strain SS14) TaxID=990650 RepID=A0A0C9TVI1_SPHS4|nr:hypothetical protein M422DRAFT_55784 [Sphaerobolus stellatus SS14]